MGLPLNQPTWHPWKRRVHPFVEHHQFYDGEESCFYIIDAKLEGNLGRYLNVRPPFAHLYMLVIPSPHIFLVLLNTAHRPCSH